MAEPRPGARSGRKNRWRRRSAVAVGLVVVLGAGGYAAYAQVSKPSLDSTYRLATVDTGSVSQTLTLTGTVKRVSQVVAAFSVSSTVTAVSVNVGDTVTAGQQLATIDQTPLQAAITDAQATLLQAQAQLTSDETATTTAGTFGSSSGSTTGATGSTARGGSSGSATTPSAGATTRASTPTTTPTATPSKAAVTLPDPAPMKGAVAAMITAAKTESTACAPVLAAKPVASVPITPSSNSTTTPVTPVPTATDSPTTRTTPTTPATPTTSTTSTTSSSTSPSTPPTTSPTTPPPTSTSSPTTTYAVSPQQIAACVPAIQAWAGALTSAQKAVSDYATALAKAQQQSAQNPSGPSSHSANAGPTATPTASPTTATRPTSSGSSGATGSSGSTGASGSGSPSTLSAAATADAKQAKILSDQASITAAEQSVTAAQTNLAASTLTAPIAGVVGAVALTPGASETSSAGITIVGAGAATVTLPVPLTKLTSLKVGQAATVTAPGLDPLKGSVTMIAMLPTATTGNAAAGTVTYDVTVTLPDTPQTLATGTYVRTSVATATASDVLTLPVSALPAGVTSGSAKVTVLKGATTSSATVKVGAVGGGLVEIQSGLAKGDQVVIADVTAALPTNSTSQVRGLTTSQNGPAGTRTGAAGSGAARPRG